MKFFSTLRNRFQVLTSLESRLHKVQEALGRIEARQLGDMDAAGLKCNEFRVFSQWGEDGILQYLLRHVRIDCKLFVEFGVENYLESNTRFLLVNDNWNGLVLDGSRENIEYIRHDRIYWQHNLKAECHFITRENINSILTQHGVSGDIGILSIDIDGNDYWVWQEISVVNPAIVVIEYNARLGPDKSLTVNYDPHFERAKAHHSNIYYGASLKALCQLASQKAYCFVGCNSHGNNAFFVRGDLMSPLLTELSVEDGFVRNWFRESRGADGELSFLSAEQEQALIATLPWVEPTADSGAPQKPSTDD